MEAADPLHRSFEPVVREDTRLLVCGSLPGAQSLAARRYYAHPQNQFWGLMGTVVERDLASLAYEDRLKTLLEAGVGLWDVVASARRVGSLDSAIRDHSPHDLLSLVRRLPALRAVGFNGKTAARIGFDLLAGEDRLALAVLPSSSPAYTLAYEAKQAEWVCLRSFLKD